MKTKICPCCDQPIKGIYCKGCRKIVLNPVEQDVKYFLNERHPEFEKDCSFHDDAVQNRNSDGNRASRSGDSKVRSADHRMTASETEAKKAEIKERILARKREQENTPKQTVSSAGKKIVIGIVIYLIVIFVGVIGITFSQIFDVFDMFEMDIAVPEPEIAIEQIAPSAEAVLDVTTEDSLLKDWERSDEEVKSAGVACTGYGHFDVVFADVKTEFLECLKEDGLLCSEEEPYSYNSQMDFDSWYQTVYGFTVETEEDYVGIVEIETDTATGQIHGISLYTNEGDDFFQMTDAVLAFMEEVGLVSEELPHGQEFYKIAMGGDGEIQRDDGVVVMFGLEVSCYVPENLEHPDFYSMSMYAPGYMTSANE